MFVETLRPDPWRQDVFGGGWSGCGGDPERRRIASLIPGVRFDQRRMGIGGEGIRERIARAIGIGGGQINLGKMFCDTCMSSSPSRLSHLIHRLHLPFWASNTRIGLCLSLGPWAGCIWNWCSTTRAANILWTIPSANLQPHWASW